MNLRPRIFPRRLHRCGRALAGSLLLVFGISCAQAGNNPAAAVVAEAPCGVPTDLLQHNPPLRNVAKALSEKRLKVLVWGTRSTGGAGTSGTDQAYPAHLRARLAERYPDVKLEVEVLSQPGQIATQMVRGLQPEVIARKPDLVVWQTGSADAVRNTSLQEFGRAVSRALRTLRGRNIDVMLMDMQYGPYSDLLANFRPYRGYLWWASRQEDVALLPRYQIMELWEEQGRFDLGTEDRKLQRVNADAIHACLGDLLGWMVIDAAERGAAQASTKP
jgi:acyl-CoA thioesterase I